MNIKTSTGVKLGTNILSIKVPAMLRLRQDLGIEWMNNAMGGGGMTPSTVTMVTGSPGCGKSTLMRQLANSTTAAGHIAVYNSGEESVYQVKMRCEDMELEAGFEIGEEKFTEPLIAYLKALQKRYPNKQVFLFQDSLQTLDDGHYKNGTTSMTPVRVCTELTNWAKETFGIVVFVGQVTKSGVFVGKNTIRHMIDAHAEILHDKDPKSPTCGKLLFEVTKNRFGCTGKTFVVELGKRGLFVGDEVIDSRPIDDEDDEVDTVVVSVPNAVPIKRTISGVQPRIQVTVEPLNKAK